MRAPVSRIVPWTATLGDRVRLDRNSALVRSSAIRPPAQGALGLHREAAQFAERQVDPADDLAGSFKCDLGADEQAWGTPGRSIPAAHGIATADRAARWLLDGGVADQQLPLYPGAAHVEPAVDDQAAVRGVVDEKDATADHRVAQINRWTIGTFDACAGQVERAVNVGAQQPQFPDGREAVQESNGTADADPVGLQSSLPIGMDDGVHTQQPTADLRLAQPDRRPLRCAGAGAVPARDVRAGEVKISTHMNSIGQEARQPRAAGKREAIQAGAVEDGGSLEPAPVEVQRKGYVQARQVQHARHAGVAYSDAVGIDDLMVFTAVPANQRGVDRAVLAAIGTVEDLSVVAGVGELTLAHRSHRAHSPHRPHIRPPRPSIDVCRTTSEPRLPAKAFDLRYGFVAARAGSSTWLSKTLRSFPPRWPTATPGRRTGPLAAYRAVAISEWCGVVVLHPPPHLRPIKSTLLGGQRSPATCGMADLHSGVCKIHGKDGVAGSIPAGGST